MRQDYVTFADAKGLSRHRVLFRHTLKNALIPTVRLHQPTAGRVPFDGTDITALSTDALKTMRRRMQIIFQDATPA
ncbi:MAG: ABC transporter permease subunit [Pseudomonadota bacterium]